jgi:tetratricopeptide (TPR) repeat protein
MNEHLDFWFKIPQPPEGPLVELSAAEAEQFLREKLDEAGAVKTEALWQLAQFYKLNNRPAQARQRLRQLLPLLPDPEAKASCFFTMGQTEEKARDYAAAIRYYKAALALEPASLFTWYFIHNNLGYSLNTLGRFAEGEACCRQAIQIDPTRPNGHKNLGMALTGQGQYRDAAKAFVAATQANACDSRALGLLEELLKQHPDLEYEFQDAVECCRKAIQVAAKWRKN